MPDHSKLDAFWDKTEGPSDIKVPRLDMCRSISIILKFENKAGEGADNKGEEGRGLHKIEGLRNPVTLCQLCCSYYDQFPNKFLPQWLHVSNMKLMK